MYPPIHYQKKIFIVATGWNDVLWNSASDGFIVHPPDDTLTDIDHQLNDTDNEKPKDIEESLS
jgi:hypothetical protein